MTILTAVPPDPLGYGRVLRKLHDPRRSSAIVEQKALTSAHGTAPEINSGIYASKPRRSSAISQLSTNNAHREFYLTDVAAMLVADRRRVIAIKAGNTDEVLGANTIAEMMHLDQAMRATTARRLMDSGVTIFRPDTCHHRLRCHCRPDTIIEPFVQLLGSTRIGGDCRIRSYSVIQHSISATTSLVRNGCVLDGARIGDGALLGPYAHLRPESNIGADAHVGNF